MGLQVRDLPVEVVEEPETASGPVRVPLPEVTLAVASGLVLPWKYLTGRLRPTTQDRQQVSVSHLT